MQSFDFSERTLYLHSVRFLYSIPYCQINISFCLWISLDFSIKLNVPVLYQTESTSVFHNITKRKYEHEF